MVNNNYMDSVTFGLRNITQSIEMAANSRDALLSMPNAQWANNITIRDCGTVFLPSLESVNGSVGMYGNHFNTLAIWNLESVGGSLSFVSNDKLSDLSMPSLKKVAGGVEVLNNTEMVDLVWSSLEIVGGAVHLEGSFQKFVHLLHKTTTSSY